MRFRRQTRTTIERKGTTTSRVFVYTVRIVQPYSRTYLVDVDDEKRKRRRREREEVTCMISPLDAGSDTVDTQVINTLAVLSTGEDARWLGR
jgi:hypothetical protein